MLRLYFHLIVYFHLLLICLSPVNVCESGKLANSAPFFKSNTPLDPDQIAGLHVPKKDVNCFLDSIRMLLRQNGVQARPGSTLFAYNISAILSLKVMYTVCMEQPVKLFDPLHDKYSFYCVRKQFRSRSAGTTVPSDQDLNCLILDLFSYFLQRDVLENCQIWDLNIIFNK